MFPTGLQLLSTEYRHKEIINGKPVLYTVRRSPRAQNVRLEIKRQTGLVVIVPHSFKNERLPEVLKNNAEWILLKLAKYESVPPRLISGT